MTAFSLKFLPGSAILAFAAVAVARRPTSTEAPSCGNAPFVMRGARVFDGDSLRVGVDVFVAGDTIAAVGRGLTVPARVRECDASGRTLLPGLIDAHAHVQDSISLREALVFGVTTELDMFSVIDSVMRPLRLSGLANRSHTMADLRSAGTLVTAPHGHGTEYGFVIPVLDSAAGARALVDRFVREGSDYIKIVYDDGAEWGMHMPTLSRTAMTAAVAAARGAGKTSIIHIGSFVDARAAVGAGANVLGHFFADSMPDPDFGKFVASHGVSVITTLSPLVRMSGNMNSANSALDNASMKRLMDSTQIAELTDSFTLKVKSHMAVINALAQQLRAAHVRVLAGSDSPNPGSAHGVAMHLELGNMVRAGFTPLEALRAATSAPADVFGLTDRGRIRAGARADLLLVRGDPTETIGSTMSIDGVWKRGVAVSRVQPSLALASMGRTTRASFEPSRVTLGASAAKINVVLVREWRPISDSSDGGHSTPSIAVVGGGAENSRSALRVSATLEARRPAAFAGVAFRPRRVLMAPSVFVNRSGFDVWVKGDSVTGRVVLRLANGTKVTLPMPITHTWTVVHIGFADAHVDPAQVTGVDFLAAPSGTAKSFSFEIDEFVLR